MSILCKWEEGWGEKTEGGSEQKGGEGGEEEWKWICVCALQSIFVCLSICPRAAQSAINLTSSWQHECLVVWHCVCELESGWYHQFLYWKHTGKLEAFNCYMASWKEQQLNSTLVEVFSPVRVSSFETCLWTIRNVHAVIESVFKWLNINQNFPWLSRPEVCCGGCVLKLALNLKILLSVSSKVCVPLCFSVLCCHRNIVGVTVQRLLYKYLIYTNVPLPLLVESIIFDRFWIFTYRAFQ